MAVRWLVFGLAACGSGGGFPDARAIDAPPPGGTFTLDWSVTDAANQNLACDKIGAQSVTVLAHNRAFDGGNTQVFTCSTGMGMSQPMPPGTYDFDFELDATTSVLATAPAQHTIEITSAANVRLTPLAFSVDATGGLALSLASGRAGGNCGLIANGGAGITTMQFALMHASDLSCEPAVLSISASALTGAPASMYTINCTTPTTSACVETDQTITATVPSDAYMIRVRGREGAPLCWANNDSMQVPPLGQVLSRTLNLGFASATAGCM